MKPPLLSLGERRRAQISPDSLGAKLFKIIETIWAMSIFVFETEVLTTKRCRGFISAPPGSVLVKSVERFHSVSKNNETGLVAGKWKP